MSINDNEKVIAVSDLALAATISLFFPIHSINRTNTQKVEFTFVFSDKLRSLISDYWADKVKVEPKTYYTQLKSLKTRIYGGI